MKELKDKMMNHFSKGKDLLEDAVTSEDAALIRVVSDFQAEFALALNGLAAALDEAGISHYSSGCGTQRVTFDIFPASQHVRDLLGLLSLERTHLSKTTYGLKDASATGDYNPANEFLAFLRRWRGFAEHAMRNEGDSERGIAAARAKLLMDDLVERLGQSAEAGDERRNGVRLNAFASMMRAIGQSLEMRRRRYEESKRLSSGSNYDRALAKAKGHLGAMPLSPKVAAHLRAQSA